MRSIRLALAVLAVGGANAVGAQSVSAGNGHEGFWVGVGLGASHTNISCTGCNYTASNDPWRGGLGTGLALSLGGTASPQLLLGAELSAGVTMSGTGDRSAGMGRLLFVAQYYPDMYGGFFVRGGVGPAAIDLEDNGATVHAGGFAAQAGVGYDFRVGRRFAIAPYATLGHTGISQASIETTGSAGTVTKLQPGTYWNIGLSFNWY